MGNASRVRHRHVHEIHSHTDKKDNKCGFQHKRVPMRCMTKTRQVEYELSIRMKQGKCPRRDRQQRRTRLSTQVCSHGMNRQAEFERRQYTNGTREGNDLLTPSCWGVQSDGGFCIGRSCVMGTEFDMSQREYGYIFPLTLCRERCVLKRQSGSEIKSARDQSSWLRQPCS